MPSNTFNCFTIPRNRLKRLLLQRAQTKNRPSHFRDRHLESFSRRRGHSCCRTIAVCGFLYCASIHLFPFCLLVEANKCEGTAKLVVSSVSNRNCLLWKARRAEQSQIQYPIKTPAGLFLFFFCVQFGRRRPAPPPFSFPTDTALLSQQRRLPSACRLLN